MSDRDNKYTPKDWVKDFIFFIITVGVSYGYVLLILLIISFMLPGIIKPLGLDFETMLILSGIGAVIMAVWYIIKMVKKYR